MAKFNKYGEIEDENNKPLFYNFDDEGIEVREAEIGLFLMIIGLFLMVLSGDIHFPLVSIIVGCIGISLFSWLPYRIYKEFDFDKVFDSDGIRLSPIAKFMFVLGWVYLVLLILTS